jgi:hypothetical protein
MPATRPAGQALLSHSTVLALPFVEIAAAAPTMRPAMIVAGLVPLMLARRPPAPALSERCTPR